MSDFLLTPIGIIHTPFFSVKDMPIQPFAAKGVKGYIELFEAYSAGLKDIEGFSHITLIYRFHQIADYALEVVPFMDTDAHGIFATRAPRRPNALGLSTVRLLGVEGNILHIEEPDMLDGTPLLDIKPFFPRYDNREAERIGWLEKSKDFSPAQLRSDERFA